MFLFFKLIQTLSLTLDISMATQRGPGPLHPKGNIRVPLLQEVIFFLDIHSGVRVNYGHLSLSDS